MDMVVKMATLVVLASTVIGNFYLYSWLAFNMGLYEKTGLVIGIFWLIALIVLLHLRNIRKNSSRLDDAL